MSNYSELQNKAKELGLPYVGVSRKALEESIAKASGKNTEIPSAPSVQSPINSSEEGVRTEAQTDNAPVPPQDADKPEKPAKKSKSQAKREKVQKESAQKTEKVGDETPAQLTPEPVAPKILKNYEIEAPEDTNMVIVLDGINKVRSYSADLHGENFLELARGFVKDRPSFRLEFKNQNQVLKCPNCGSEIKCGTCGKAIS